MNNEILDLKHKFYFEHQQDKFYKRLIQYSKCTNFSQILTDEWLKAHNYQCYCYDGALFNMYYFNQIGKDVTFNFGTVDSSNIISHAWIEVDNKEYHINRPCQRSADGTCNYYPLKILDSKFIPANTDREDIPKLFIKTDLLNEDTRTALITKSRNKGYYKDTSRGKNRFERKKYSKIANTVKQYNSIDMNALFKQDILKVSIPIVGETDNYTVTLKINGVVAEIAKNIKNNQNKLEYRTIIQSLTKMFNTTDVYIKCTCPDHLYNYAHWNIINNVSVDDTSQDPGPGKGIANPNDDKGRGCKHILLVLANGDWLMKVASVINNYVHYASEKMQKAFKKLIFPKLYGVTVDDAAEFGLVEDEKDLETNKDLIDIINEYGRNRGKFQKGSNKNPITGTGGRTQKETKNEPKLDSNKKEEDNTKSDKKSENELKMDSK